MLVIRRRPGESILVGNDVEIQVIEIGPTRVKLGIRAAASIPVVRKEAQLTREQNVAAAHGLDANAIAAFLGLFRQ